MAVAAGVMTVEEFRRLPEPTDGTYLELHGGEVVRLTCPKFRHASCQRRIAALLSSLAGDCGEVYVELGFRALPEYEARRADVAYLSGERLDRVVEADDVIGAPDLVVEVLSPSNTAAEMDAKERLCFSNGCREFWLVSEKERTVRVTRAGESVRWYCAGESIAVPMLGGGSVAVDDVFGG